MPSPTLTFSRRSIRTILISLLALLVVHALLLSFSGCSSGAGSNALARVGDYDITVNELNDYARDLSFDNATLQEEIDGKKQILDSLIYKRLLIQGAYEKGIQNVEEVSRAVLNSRNQFLIDVLYDQKVRKQVTVTGKEMREFWEKLADVVHVQQIVLLTQDSAEIILGKLRAGENFEQLAYDHSLDPSAKRTRGDLGFLQWGALSQEIQQAAFAMKPMEVSPPIKSRMGFFHIIRVTERRPNSKRRPIEEMRDELYTTVYSLKSRLIANDYFDEMRKIYKLAIDTATIQYLLQKRSNLYPPQVLATLPKTTFDITQLDRNEKELKIASWSGGQVSVSEFLTLSEQSGVPAQNRPDLDQYDSLASFIFDLKRSDFLVQEATKTGLDKNEDFVRRMKLMKELTMAEIMANDSLTAGQQISDQMSREFYDKNAKMYTRGARIRLYEILTSDQNLAARLAREVKSLNEFATRAVQYTERDTRKGTNGDLGYIEAKNLPEIFAAAEQTAVGAIGGPVATEGKFSIFYVVDKLPSETIDYLGVKRDIVAMLVDSARVQTARNWAAERRKAAKVEIFEKNLEKAIADRRAKYEAYRAL